MSATREPLGATAGQAVTPGAGRAPMAGAVLPSWAPWGVPGGLLAVAVALAVATNLAPALLLVVAVVVGGAVLYVWSRSVEGARRATDRSVTLGVTAAFVLAVAPLVSVLTTVIDRGLARFDGTFLTETARNVVGEGGGALHAIVGTLVIAGVATLIAVPIGILAAIYLVEYGQGRLKRAITFFVDVMTGIPSIVAGLFAVALFTLVFGPGTRLGIMGSIALTVLMIPIVVRSTEEMLLIVPDKLREAAYALGVPKWRMIVKVVLPTALAGIVSGVMLAIARIMGETAPLLVTAGVSDSINTNPVDGRMPNLAVYAYSEYKFPGVPREPFLDRAWAAALTLILIVMLLNLVGRFIYRRFGTEIR
ncbi:MAG: phosphate ABC transporter permease PstA [Solirubrobacteraceae bacterium]